MSEPGAHDPEVLERMVARLHDAAARLRGGELTPQQAAEEVEALAQGAAQASAELERLARAAASEPMGSPPTPDQLV